MGNMLEMPLPIDLGHYEGECFDYIFGIVGSCTSITQNEFIYKISRVTMNGIKNVTIEMSRPTEILKIGIGFYGPTLIVRTCFRPDFYGIYRDDEVIEADNEGSWSSTYIYNLFRRIQNG